MKTILDYCSVNTPTQQQIHVLREMESFVHEENTNDFLILAGAAGTGKTTITTALINFLSYQDILHSICAPTGRAARILGKKSRTTNSTIHSLIYNVKTDPESGDVICTLKNNDDPDYHIFIVDEASMISSIYRNENQFRTSKPLLDDLITFVKSGNQDNKIIFIGDQNQLAPVFENTSRALDKGYLEQQFGLTGTKLSLTEVMRQSEDSVILRNATIIRNAIEKNINNVSISGFHKLGFMNSRSNYLEALEKNQEDHVISIACSNKMNFTFNQQVRRMRFGDSTGPISKGDILVVSRTWKRLDHELFSGDHLKVVDFSMEDVRYEADLTFIPVKLEYKNVRNEKCILEDYIILEHLTSPAGLTAEQEKNLKHERIKKNKSFRETQNIQVDKYLGALRVAYGYSITCNKAQGGEWDNVFLNSFMIPNLRFAYTAITRAKKNLFLY